MDEKRELDPATHEEIKRLCRMGDALAEQRKYDEAIAEYTKAWNLVPEPASEWAASTWILAAVADAYFLAGYDTSAKEALEYAMICPGAVGNPFLHLRLGQVLFEKNELDRSADELMRAYMAGGEEVFELEDPKYLSFLKTRATL
jgi:tetratricopeptide (TPR) repeat protein